MKSLICNVPDWAALVHTKISCFAFCIALIVPELSVAGSFSVSPIRIELSKKSPTAIIQVANPGAMEIGRAHV